MGANWGRNAVEKLGSVALLALFCTCASPGQSAPTVRHVAALIEKSPLQVEALGRASAHAEARPERAPLVLTALNRPGDQLEVQPYDDEGKLIPEAHEAISRFLRCQRTGRVKRVHEGVVAFLYQIALDYPGKSIEVISGFRARSRKDSGRSPHTRALAVDLRIKGVKLHKLRKHLWKTYAGLAVGYYPHSGWVHVDVRDKPVRWIEYRHKHSGYALHTADELASLKPVPTEFPLVQKGAPAEDHAHAHAHDHSHGHGHNLSRAALGR